MKTRKIVTLTLLLFVVQWGIAGEVTKVGTSSANFLKIEVGARASALGGAFVSQSNDLTALYWNPAGLAFQSSLQAQFEHLSLYADIKHDYAALAFPIANNLMVGLSTIYLTSGDIEITTEQDWEGTGRYYDVTNMSLGLTIARRMTDRLTAGVTVKYLRESIWRNTASALAADFGFIVNTEIMGLKLGMSLTNIGTPMQMRGIDMQFNADAEYTGLMEADAQLIGEHWPLPTTFKIGLSTYLIGRDGEFLKSDRSDVCFLVDFFNALDSDLKSNLGLEYTYAKQYSLRAGYRINYDEVTFSTGAGIKIRTGESTIVSIDYSYTDFGALEGLHRIGVSLSP